MKATPPGGQKSYPKRSKLPDHIVEHNNRLFAYKQQSKLVNVAAKMVVGHVQLAKRNRKDNQQRK